VLARVSPTLTPPLPKSISSAHCSIAACITAPSALQSFQQ
jgi:hypothetical protein